MSKTVKHKEMLDIHYEFSDDSDFESLDHILVTAKEWHNDEKIKDKGYEFLEDYQAENYVEIRLKKITPHLCNYNIEDIADSQSQDFVDAVLPVFYNKNETHNEFIVNSLKVMSLEHPSCILYLEEVNIVGLVDESTISASIAKTFKSLSKGVLPEDVFYLCFQEKTFFKKDEKGNSTELDSKLASKYLEQVNMIDLPKEISGISKQHNVLYVSSGSRDVKLEHCYEQSNIKKPKR